MRIRTVARIAAIAVAVVAVLGSPLPSEASGYSVLHSFTGTDGSPSHARLVLGRDGAFYGTTPAGGAYGQGTIFKMTAPGVVTVLHSFERCDPFGYAPTADLIEASDGYLYGTASRGGTGNDCTGSLDTRYGTVFRSTKSGRITVLHVFGSRSGGQYSYAGVTEARDGWLYGATYSGGISTSNRPEGRGVVYKVSKSGSFRVLHALVASDGQNPLAAPTQASDAFLYGMTSELSAAGESAGGTIYRIDGQGTFTRMVALPGASQPTGKLLQAGNGWLYGVGPGGGPYGMGSIFRMRPGNGSSFEVVFSFGSDGGYPSSGMAPADALVQARDGNLYGVTRTGGLPIGDDNRGVIFKLDTSGHLGVLHTFHNTTAGFSPLAALAQSWDGSLYGLAFGGATNNGVAYRFDPTATGPVQRVSVYPTAVIGGDAVNGTARGVVLLDGVAPSAGATISLRSSDTKAAAVPSSVTIAAGWENANFSVGTQKVPKERVVTITASWGGKSVQTTLHVLP